ncbi:hypothetical protein Scep_005551 [Stephania cephalantha]|uniref:DUF641 domain-containing protein n=1 Tax=Stephania cephalantha TaxID=152367 RepID=A0AAP0PWH6_9MAGN
MWTHLFSGKSSRQKKAERNGIAVMDAYDLNLRTSVPLSSKITKNHTGFSISCEEIRATKKRPEMANKVSNFSDLIHKVTSSCLLNPIPRARERAEILSDIDDQIEIEDSTDDEEEEEESIINGNDDNELISSDEEDQGFGAWNATKKTRSSTAANKRMVEFEALMGEIFDAVSSLKRAYVGLQEAHCPWDPEKMSVSDMAILSELSRLARLRERYKRMCRGGSLGFAPLREAVAPYEAAVEELKREVKNKEAEVLNLKEKLKRTSIHGGNKKISSSRRKVSCILSHGIGVAPVPELFEATMAQVKESSKAFTSLLLSLMRAARWDIAAAVRSIESATAAAVDATAAATTTVVGPHHAKYALESYICRKIFHGFDHETFYIDGSLSSLLHPDQFRRDCFSHFKDMKSMDPSELLGILPSCHFGKFCSKKYQSVVHPKMEESLFGNLEQHQLVTGGSHPRTQFYREFLGLAKAVWLLHLLAFAMEPSPCLFLATRGAEFHPEYMESVVRGRGRGSGVGQIVGVPVCPGFKLGNGSVIKARVYLVSNTS